MSQTPYGRDVLEAIGPYLDGVFPPELPLDESAASPPALLSETGVFLDMETLTPRDGLLPYDVNAPLWSDGAMKRRWIAVPNDGKADSARERIGFEAAGSWTFPPGTVFVKQFDLPIGVEATGSVRRLETRFLVRTEDGGVYGVTYRWREDGTEADLLRDGMEEEVPGARGDGTRTTQIWSYPGRQDCLGCHQAKAGGVLGVRTHQLNGAYRYGEREDNQLRTWNHLGLFSPALDEGKIPALGRAAGLDDETASLSSRVRSYLDSNCASCHQPGILATRFDLRWTTPAAEQGMIGGSVLYDLGVPEARVVAAGDLDRSLLYVRMSSEGPHRMPPLGRNVVDEAAVAAVGEWILSLESGEGPVEGNRAPVAQDDEASTRLDTAVEMALLSNDVDLDGDRMVVGAWTEPGHGTLDWLENGRVRYQPEDGFAGSDRFTYVVEDDEGMASNEAVVSVRVLALSNATTVGFVDGSSRLSAPGSAGGVGMAIADMDGDGLDDVVHLQKGERLWIDYQNADGASFTGRDAGEASGHLQWGVAVADADGNGYPDIITGGYYDYLHLFWNEGGRGPLARTSLREPRLFLQGIQFADVDRDGMLDVFACHDMGDNVKFRGLGARKFMADSSLIDTRTAPASDNSGNYGSVWTDYDGDGDVDLYVAKCRAGVNDDRDPRRVNMLLRNDGASGFRQVAPEAGLAFGAQSWTADFADIDNDGHLDVFVGNHDAPSVLMRNGGEGVFEDVTATAGLTVAWRVVQAAFRDFNNDGWVDLLLAGERHELWVNDRSGGFALAPNPFTAQMMESCAVGDLNADGFTDVYGGYAELYNTPRASRPDKLFLAVPNGNGFLSVGLRGSGQNSTAVGARLELRGPWGVQVREVRGGEGYGVTHSARHIFGLGDAIALEGLRVRWPSGTMDEIAHPKPNAFLEIREGSTAPPVLEDPGPQVNVRGEVLSWEVKAVDPTGDRLTYEATGLPPGLRLDAVTGVVEGRLEEGSEGRHSVLLRVRDEWNTVTQAFSWEVTAPEAPPTVTLSTEGSTVEGDFQVTARFSRPVWGFSLEGVEVSNGSLSHLVGGATEFAFTVHPGVPGSVEVYVTAGAARDSEGRVSGESNRLPVQYVQGTGQSDVLLRIEALPVVGPASVAVVTVDCEVGEARDLGLWLEDSTTGGGVLAAGVVRLQAGLHRQKFAIGVPAGIREGTGYRWVARLMPIGWVGRGEALAQRSRAVTVVQDDGGGEGKKRWNMAAGPDARARQSTTYADLFGADRARDGSTDGDLRQGSVAQTGWGMNPWWEVDLGRVEAIDRILLWNRTDCCGQALASSHVFLSAEPIVSQDPDTAGRQPGVARFSLGEGLDPARQIDVDGSYRYVRIQLAGFGSLNLAEVQVYGAAPAIPPRGVTYAYFEGLGEEDEPDLSSWFPVDRGALDSPTLDLRRREDFYGFRFAGSLMAPVTGQYWLRVRTAGGVRWSIEGERVLETGVDADETVREISSEPVRLQGGANAFQLETWMAEGPDVLELWWQGPGFEMEPVTAAAWRWSDGTEDLGRYREDSRIGADDNRDGDLLDWAAEYALGRSAEEAWMKDAGLVLGVDEAGEGVVVEYERPAGVTGIDYTLEVSEDMRHWRSAGEGENLGGSRVGWEMVRYQGAMLGEGDRGFVRLRMWHHGWNHESHTPAMGWMRTVLGEGYQTHGVTLGAPPVYVGRVAGVVSPTKEGTGERLLFIAGGLRRALAEGGSYYAEIAEGVYEGHRLAIDEEASGDQALAVDWDGEENTLTVRSLGELRDRMVVVRRHWSLADIYPPDRFGGGTEPAVADQVQFYGRAGYQGYFLLRGGGRNHWVAIGDAALEDRGGDIILPGVGAFVRRVPGTGEMAAWTTGHVREHGTVLRLRPGPQLVTPMRPVAASASQLGLGWGGGSVGHRDPVHADQLWFWSGDRGEPARSFITYYLLDAGPGRRHWAAAADTALRDADDELLFSGDRAFFFHGAEPGNMREFFLRPIGE